MPRSMPMLDRGPRLKRGIATARALGLNNTGSTSVPIPIQLSTSFFLVRGSAGRSHFPSSMPREPTAPAMERVAEAGCCMPEFAAYLQ